MKTVTSHHNQYSLSLTKMKSTLDRLESSPECRGDHQRWFAFGIHSPASGRQQLLVPHLHNFNESRDFSFTRTAPQTKVTFSLSTVSYNKRECKRAHEYATLAICQ
eukprot:scpid54084/ scgid35241/ 